MNFVGGGAGMLDFVGDLGIGEEIGMKESRFEGVIKSSLIVKVIIIAKKFLQC